LSWAAGDGTDKNINVTLCDDSELETAETFNLALSNPTGAVLGSPNAITWGINDNDATLQFTSATGTVGEGDGTITLTVTRQGANVPASVNYATASGTATGGASCVAGVDFINTSGTLNFAFAETS